ncbi:hypothetical protein HMPREF9080_01476 [Cardiobacterium valvarum F0432]|uniref:Uncharacterized protein n=1 Tax=Cardiobacterium valvarum F0432 TaxID=797473 RepID=G9ZFD1_9GAMM|nr:hypothetical protein HMPREF9080_01476 [Cardiobacterium valvarum F0432]
MVFLDFRGTGVPVGGGDVVVTHDDGRSLFKETVIIGRCAQGGADPRYN